MTLAQRKVITVGNKEIDAFMLPNGNYVLSMTGAAEAIGKQMQSVQSFLKSKIFLEQYGGVGVEIEEVTYEGHNIPIKAVPPVAVSIYWQHWSDRSKEAKVLVVALLKEALDIRLTKAFLGIQKSVEEVNEETANQMEELRKAISDSLPRYTKALEQAATRYWRKCDYFQQILEQRDAEKNKDKRKSLEALADAVGMEVLAFRREYDSIRKIAKEKIGIEIGTPLPDYWEAEYLKYEPVRSYLGVERTRTTA